MSIDIQKADAFAAEKHKNQRRKDAAETPYIVHPRRVVKRLEASWNNQYDDDEVVILVAALLHDTVEDTGTTLDETPQKEGPASLGGAGRAEGRKLFDER